MRSMIVGLLLFALAGAAAAQYPQRPVRVVVPFAAGAGSNDIMARLLGQKLSDGLGQQFVIDNRPGASGIVGTDIVAKAQPDGYTLLVMSLTLAVNPSVFKLPYQTERDLAPITLIASAPLILVVHPQVPAKNVAEFLAYARANSGKLNYGSGGVAATPHLAAEMLALYAGFKATHVPYKGGAPALADLVGGQLTFMLENIPGTLPFVKSGRLRVLAITDSKRSPLLPDVPTLAESGVKDYELVGWNGLFAPAATPKPVIDKLHAEAVKALAQPDVKERFTTMGAEGVGDTPEHFRAFIHAEIAKWARVVKAAGIKID